MNHMLKGVLKFIGTLLGYLLIVLNLIIAGILGYLLTLPLTQDGYLLVVGIGGVVIWFDSFTFQETGVNVSLTNFLLFHAFFLIGVTFMLTWLKTGFPITAVNSFELGSFALILTIFFIPQPSQASSLLYSVSSTILFFVSGTVSAFYEILLTSSSFVRPDTLVLHFFSDSLNLLGAFDLLILALRFLYLFGHGLRNGREPAGIRLYSKSVHHCQSVNTRLVESS